MLAEGGAWIVGGGLVRAGPGVGLKALPCVVT